VLNKLRDGFPNSNFPLCDQVLLEDINIPHLSLYVGEMPDG